MVTVILAMALIIMSGVALYLFLKGEDKNREISRLDAKVNFLQGAWDDSKTLVSSRSEEVNRLKDSLSVIDKDLASLVEKLAQKDAIITDMAHEINRLSTPSVTKKAKVKKVEKADKKPIKPRAKNTKK